LNAVEVFKLFLLLSIGFLYLWGQVWLLIGPLLNESLIHRKKEVPLLQEIPILLIGGLIINYGIIICSPSLKGSLIFGGILSIIGFFCYLFMVLRTRKIFRLSTYTLEKVVGSSFICFLFLGPILFLPLFDWDALSIWFLHAKLIFSAGTFNQVTDWLHPSIAFSHIDYPNLVPALAGQISFLMGYWNEFLPKLSLFYFLVPAILLLFSFYQRNYSFKFLIILIPFSYASRLWDGYMDGYLAVYFALFTLFLGRYIKKPKPVNLITGIFCLIPLLYLKNEGVLGIITGISMIFLTLLFNKVEVSLRPFFVTKWKIIISYLILLIPFFVWNYYKQNWGITNDLELGTSQSLLRFGDRINNGSLRLVFENTFFELKNGLMLLGVFLIATFALKNKIPKEIIPIFSGVVIYCLGIMAVYMVTPYDLQWHLHQSIYRTLLPVNMSLYVTCFFIFLSLENNQNVKNEKFQE